jgi:deazaflavin-dependent oxidoreductase (nitroreductase family)
MAERAYLKPPWWIRVVGNRLAPLNSRRIAQLSVPGRRSGQWRTVPIVVMDHDGERYLVAPFGDSDWSRNLRASGGGRLVRKSRVEEFTAVEVAPPEHESVVEEYKRRYAKMPGVTASFTRLPDPADHPAFRIVPQPRQRSPVLSPTLWRWDHRGCEVGLATGSKPASISSGRPDRARRTGPTAAPLQSRVADPPAGRHCPGDDASTSVRPGGETTRLVIRASPAAA